MDMSLSKFQKLVKDREAWRAARVRHDSVTELNQASRKSREIQKAQSMNDLTIFCLSAFSHAKLSKNTVFILRMKKQGSDFK